jgi:hypothetical protein
MTLISKQREYDLLAILNLPYMHWSLGLGWIMEEQLYDFVKKKQRKIIKADDFIVVSADDTSYAD